MPRIRQTRRAALAALALLLGGRAARAQSNVDVLTIDATRSGCTACSSFAGAAPGQVTALVGDKVQLTVGAGTYTVTNAATAAGARPGANPSFTA